MNKPDVVDAGESEVSLQSVENDSIKLETEQTEEYAYLERGGFSSEKFKIELKGLPKFYGIAELKKLMNEKLDLNCSKIKRPKPGSHWLYACFQNETDRAKAIQALNGYSWKNKSLIAHVAQPAPDPFVKKRKNEDDNRLSKKEKKDDRSQEVRLKEAVTPYWNISYETQLEMKQKEMKKLLMSIDNDIWKANYSLREHIQKNRKLLQGLSFKLLPIEPSPVTEGYRNKCEFTVGIDDETQLPTVGFRLGSYATGTVAVAPVQSLTQITDAMKNSVLLFQKFVRESGMLPFSPADYSGYWRCLTVRQSTANGEVMLIISFYPQDLNPEALEKLKEELTNYFNSDDAKACKITSVYWELLSKKRVGEEGSKPEHLLGATHITDVILGLKFRISPEAFFQVNTKGADVLYQKAIDLCQPTKDTTVIDICCGTGTIGLCFAKVCGRVLGVESVAGAVSDARANAVANGIDNCEFYQGRAEDVLPSVLARCDAAADMVAIVDPPRAGLHMRAVTQLRNCARVRQLVYISCSPASARKNLVDLARATSKTLRGAPFVPVAAVPVDMFPHTSHTELAILFHRMQDTEESKEPKTEEVKTEDSEAYAKDSKEDGCKEEDANVEESSVGDGTQSSIENSNKSVST